MGTMKLDSQIMLTWGWLRYALRRLVRGQRPYLRARSVPSLTGGLATPWASVQQGQSFGGASHGFDSCVPIEIEMVSHTPLLPAEGGSWSYRRHVGPPTVGPVAVVRPPHSTRRGTSSPMMVAVCGWVCG